MELDLFEDVSMFLYGIWSKFIKKSYVIASDFLDLSIIFRSLAIKKLEQVTIYNFSKL